ncbi:Glycosyltransferase involved in cell wall bisynthesis [Parapedobacter luteus]|uniref:Glycosyltransferase involved in cell wall bisynthesis n=1 Tax=Parapedobacter luteus TaxID=623280 RepID=A0A1T5BND3_9SPHI|nr:glycosyltransferase family 1 protein [Parapedobacter luteus]SKB48754.1 Glycosyltransferase involved in cell wall bisynthesis [Parapedobacter luteus]
MKNKVYLLYYDFKHTSGNHAGMAYFSRQLANQVPQIVLVKHINQEYRGGRFVAYIYAICIFIYLLFVLKKGDKVVFMEYLSKYFAHQNVIANLLRRVGLKQRLAGLVHLGGKHLLSLYGSKREIKKQLAVLDQVIVFGGSLAEFIREVGYEGEVVQTFHYVDTAFYQPDMRKKQDDNRLHVLFMGSLLRNFAQLEKIIAACSGQGIVFHIGMGKSKRMLLSHSDHVRIYGYLTEMEMLKLMQCCDVNLSVLEDTIGSNVITSTLAAGLIQVVTEVGSIRDYCDERDSFFCRETVDYINALNQLASCSQLREEMRTAAINKGTSFDLMKSIQAFHRLITID